MRYNVNYSSGYSTRELLDQIIEIESEIDWIESSYYQTFDANNDARLEALFFRLESIEAKLNENLKILDGMH